MIKKLISFFLCFVFCVNLIQVIGEDPGGGPFTITVSVEGNGHFMYGEFSENNRVIEVPAGSNHYFYIEAEEGYEIEEVFVDGASVGIINEHEFNDISDNHTLHAKFVPSQYKIHVTSGENGQIKYNGQPENGTDVFVNKNEDATFEIEADQGYDIDDVLVNGDSVGAIPSYTFMNVTTDQSIHATFKPKTFEITTIVKDNEDNEGVGGEISCLEPLLEPLTDIPYDADRTFNILPDAGYRIKEIRDNGENRGADNTYQLNHIRENHTIEVIFEPIGDGTMHTITVQEPVNGSVTATGMVDWQVEVKDGYDVTFTVTPDPGYRISAVMITEDGFTDDWSWNLAYLGNGDFEFPLFEVRGNMDIEFVFEEEDLESLLENNFVVLEEETESDSDLKESLIRQFGGYGYAISEGNITITDVDKEDIDNDDYGDIYFYSHTRR
ncbi:MAG: InlB B-repeat-containing protein [Acetivibrionales bacterium]